MARGAGVVVTGREPDALAEAVTALGGPGVTGNAGDGEHRAVAVRTALETFGSLGDAGRRRRDHPGPRPAGRPGRSTRAGRPRSRPTCSGTAPAGSPARRWCSTAARCPAAPSRRGPVQLRPSTRDRTSSVSSSSR
ncbi:hypothetical protein [Geodermatophilus sp. DSM 45219]|uniref:hypothetical protein n=1 Tax=Geodermatophilus sp. DSM 45219 TaxID=1881103 RepID=UPI002100B6BD|nr:hypothetical protein [Geodermatophilus sp. DSM 45219]